MNDTDYLVQQLEECRMRDEKADEQRRNEYERRKQEHKQGYEERLRNPDDWPDAFRKQVILINRAHFLLEHEDDTEIETMFIDLKNACERAIEIWKQISDSKKGRRDELRKQLEALDDEIRLETAAMLREENKRMGWNQVPDALENNILQQFLDW